MKQVEVKFVSKIDDMELEFIYDGEYYDGEQPILKYKEDMEDRIVDTAIVLSNPVVISRSNGVDMYQEFSTEEITVMDYTVDGMSFQFEINTKEIIQKDHYLKIVYSTEGMDLSQEHEIEIFYS